MDRRCIVQLTNINHAYLNIYSPDVLSKINAKSTEWESMVPPEVANAIKSRGTVRLLVGARQRRNARKTPITISTAPINRVGVSENVSERSSP